MNEKLKIAILLLLLGNLPVSRAQQPTLRFEHGWGQPPIMAGPSVMMQDRKGLLWFGFIGNGLAKYDGYGFTYYRFDPQDSTSIVGTAFTVLWEDNTGSIWVGTGSSTTCRFDRRTETFTRLKRNPANPFAFEYANAFSQDRDGRLWVGNLLGELRVVDRTTGRFSATDYASLLGVNADSSGIVNQQIPVIYRDKAGTLWIGSLTGLHQLRLTPRGKGQPPSIRFTHYRHNPADTNSLSHNAVFHIYEDRRGVLWVGTKGGGLNAFNRTTGRFTRYRHDPNQPQSISSNVVTGIAEDPQGNLWVATDKGLNQLNPQRTHLTRYVHDPLDAFSLRSNVIGSLLMDQSGILWVSTEAGINKLDTQQKPFALYQYNPANPRSLSYKWVNALLEDAKGTVWVGTLGGGLTAWDRKTNSFTQYRHEATNAHSLVSDTVSAILEDRQKNLWITTGKVLSRLDRKTGKFIHTHLNHPFFDFHKVPSITTLYQDKAGLLWLGTTNGIIRFDPKTGAMRSYTHTPNSTEGISDWWTFAILEDKRGHLWLGEAGHALDRLDRKTGKFTHYRYDSRKPHGLSSDAVYCMYEDTRGNLWFGTGNGGLCRFDAKTETFTTYTEKQGLAGNNVFSIQEDDQGNLWLGTDNGLSRFSPQKQSFTNYDVSDGLQGAIFSTFSGGICWKGRDGMLYFGGRNGFNAFNPAAIRPNSYVPPIVITRFSLFDKPQPGKHEAARIELNYDQNFFSLEFAALNFRSPHKNQYAYQLEGVDKDWVYSGTRHVSAYTDVAPGEYVFRVKGSNNDGIWNEKGTSVRILIHPPWWRTWWFISLVAALSVGLVYTGFRYRVAQIRKEEAQKAAFSKKLSEMEMQALRAQMNPHFIFNCLNSINTFILKNQPDAASDYLAKFSRLIRLILQNSNSATITLQNELDALQLYLDMESLRFRNKFTFQIRVGPEVEPEDIDIPPLLIQPYVENAIWHGLLHKESTGHLGIDLQVEKDKLVCVIEDDGVGRRRAAELKSKSATKSKSLGMQITAHRMELMKELYGKQTTVEIVDLVADSGEACGTRAILTMSI